MDNVTFQPTVATPASGTVISTEEVTTLNGGAVTAQQVQRVAIAIRTGDGVAIDLPGDSSNGLDVDVTRIVPGTGATNLGKAEDAAHTTGDTGVMALGVRKDADGAFGADGDYAPLQFDDNGFLKVNIKAGAGAGGTAMTDDAAFTPGATSITPMGGFFDDISPDSVDEGDAGAVRMSANRNLYMQIRDGAGNERGASVSASGELTVFETNSPDILLALQNLEGVIKVDDSAFTPATDKVLMIGAEFDDTTPDSIDEGDAGAVRMSANRNLYTQIRDGQGNERSAYVDSTGRISVTDLALELALSDIDALLQAFTNPDDGSFTVGSKRVVSMGGFYNNAVPDSVNDGDTGIIRMSANRNLYIQIRDAAGNERGLNIDANGALAIGSIVPGTGATNLGKAEDAAHSSGDTGVMALGVRKDADGAFGADGDYAPFQMDALGFLKTSDQGNVAHDAADAGNPMKIGAKAIAHGSNPTAVAAGDRTDLYANRHGIPFVISGHPNILTLRANYTAAQTDTAIITQGAGGKIVVTRVSVTADNANSVDVQARIGFGTANTPTTTGVLLSHPGIAPGSGVVEGSGAGILGIGADDADLRITCEVPTGGSIDVLVSYYIIES